MMEEIKNNYPLVNDNGVTREMTEEEYAEYTAFILQLTSLSPSNEDND